MAGMQMNPWVSLVIALFGMGSWIAINGVMAELPVLVSKLPEGWNLPTYLVLIIQAANIGPITFSILRQYRKDLASLKYTAYSILMLGFVAAIFLSQFWDKTVKIGSKESSIPLLLLSFIFAFSDCTSSVVFLTFMAKYPSGYMVPFYIGGGMSGVMPSVLTLAQGTVGDTCQNASNSSAPAEPRYGGNLYFGLLSILIATSGIAFYLLNNLNISLNERYDNVLPQQSNAQASEKGENPSCKNEESPPQQDTDKVNPTNVRVFDVFCGSRRVELAQIRWTFAQLYFIIIIISALGNGIIPAILSYASLPYGPTTYHLATELALIANPLCCFLAFFLPCKKPSVIGVLCSISVVIGSVIIYTATLSPTPWLVGTNAGSVLIIILNVLWTGIISYIKVNVASVLQKFGENALLFCGIFTQMGSCLGAITIFLVNFLTNTFKPC